MSDGETIKWSSPEQSSYYPPEVLKTLKSVLLVHWGAITDFFAKVGYILPPMTDYNVELVTKHLNLYLWLRIAPENVSDFTVTLPAEKLLAGDDAALKRSLIFKGILLQLEQDLVANGFCGEVRPMAFPFVDRILSPAVQKNWRPLPEGAVGELISTGANSVAALVNPTEIPYTWSIVGGRLAFYGEFPVGKFVPDPKHVAVDYLNQNPHWLYALLDYKVTHIEFSEMTLLNNGRQQATTPVVFDIAQILRSAPKKALEYVNHRLDELLLKHGRNFQSNPFCGYLLKYRLKYPSTVYQPPLEFFRNLYIDKECRFINDLAAAGAILPATTKELSRYYNANIQRVHREALQVSATALRRGPMVRLTEQLGYDMICRGLLDMWMGWATGKRVRRIRFLKLLRLELDYLTEHGSPETLPAMMLATSTMLVQALGGEFIPAVGTIREPGPVEPVSQETTADNT